MKRKVEEPSFFILNRRMNSHIKGFIAVLVVSGVLGALWWQYRETLLEGMQPSESVKQMNAMEEGGVPDVQLPGLDGKAYNIKDFKDKVVIVNFWASWCAPCVEEFPSMLKLAEQLPNDLVILAISGDQDVASVQTFLKVFPQRPDNFKIFMDSDQAIAKKFGTQVLPESYVLTRGLKIFRKVVGTEKWDTPQAVQFFKDIAERK